MFSSGGIDNIFYTFGGYWSGVGERDDVANWIDNPYLNINEYVSSVKPRRVPHKMFTFVSTRPHDCLAFTATPSYDGTLDPGQCFSQGDLSSTEAVLEGNDGLILTNAPAASDDSAFNVSTHV